LLENLACGLVVKVAHEADAMVVGGDGGVIQAGLITRLPAAAKEGGAADEAYAKPAAAGISFPDIASLTFACPV